MKSYQNIYSILTKGEKQNFKLLILMMFFAMILETLGIASILPIINLLTNQSTNIAFINNDILNNFTEKNLVLILSCVILVIYLIKNLYLTYYYFLESKFSYNVRFNLGARLFHHYLSRPFSYHLDKHSSKLITKITQETTLVGNAVMQFSILVTEILIALGIIFLLLIIKPEETILIIVLIILFGSLFYLFSKKRSLIYGNKLVENQKTKMKILNESLSSIKEIILFKAKNYFSSKFQKKSNEVSELGYKMSFINRLPRIYFEIVVLLMVISIIIVSKHNNEDTLSTIGTLSIFLISSLKIIPSLNKIVTSLQGIKYSQAAIESLKKDVDEINNYTVNNNSSNNLLNEKFQRITLKNISFGYNSKDDKILEKINLDIKSNEFIAIIGKTGAGKSTFLNLLTGILEPTNGEILINNKSIKGNYDSLRNLIGFVPQNIYLFDDTIRKNIAFGVQEEKISNDKIIKSSSQAQLSKFISKLKNNYEFNIGENASKVSGGQKQRIAIARALYNNPPILILDEPTSSLDKETTKEIHEYLKILSKTKTIIMVSHKIDDKSLFSKTFEIKDKSISEVK